MRNALFLGPLALLVGLLFEEPSGFGAMPPPSAGAQPPKDSRPMEAVQLKKQRDVRWSLSSNFSHGSPTKSKYGKEKHLAVNAVDVSQLDQTQRTPTKPHSAFAVWLKQFDDPSLRAFNGYASVVDEKVFTDCRMVHGKSAQFLGHDGIVIGSVKLKDYDPVELVQFLVASGIVNANAHVTATVSGTHFTSEAGHWFSLHSTDPYWTNSSNVDEYDFGIHIAKDGTIRLINVQDVGQLLAKNTKVAPPR